MREAVLLVVAVVAFVGSAFVPGGAVDTATRTAAAPEGATIVDTLDPALPPELARTGRTILLRAADGHFYADARVDHRPVRFLVDTGATGVALTGADARAAGLFWSAGDLQIVAQGASGPVEGVRVTLASIELGGHQVRGLDAVIVPDGLPVSLLGQSFLSAIGEMHVEGDRMVLGR